jgi:hypothetical protein
LWPTTTYATSRGRATRDQGDAHRPVRPAMPTFRAGRSAEKTSLLSRKRRCGRLQPPPVGGRDHRRDQAGGRPNPAAAARHDPADGLGERAGCRGDGLGHHPVSANASDDVGVAGVQSSSTGPAWAPRTPAPPTRSAGTPPQPPTAPHPARGRPRRRRQLDHLGGRRRDGLKRRPHRRPAGRLRVRGGLGRRGHRLPGPHVSVGALPTIRAPGSQARDLRPLDGRYAIRQHRLACSDSCPAFTKLDEAAQRDVVDVSHNLDPRTRSRKLMISSVTFPGDQRIP